MTRHWLIRALVLVGALAAAPAFAGDSVPYGGVEFASGSNAYPTGDFYEQLLAANGDSPDSCAYHWGKGGSPFRTGPGRCDSFRVGRRWRTQYEGLVLFRDDTDLTALVGAATAGGVAIPTDATTLSSNFDHAGGGKLLLASSWPQCRGYEMQIGYEGVFGWNAGAFNPDVPPAGPLVAGTAIAQRSLTYQSSLHSLEINAASVQQRIIRPFFGIRYLRLAEYVDDVYDESSPAALTPTVSFTLSDVMRSTDVDNNLIGFQLGGRSETCDIGGRFSLSGFGSAGAYCNLARRSSFINQTDEIYTADDPATADDETDFTTATATSGYRSRGARMAFVGELGVAGAYRLNKCAKLRFGYQAMILQGVELGDALFLGNGARGDSEFLHGWFAGIERRR